MLLVCPDCLRKKLYLNTTKRLGFCHRCHKVVAPAEAEQYLRGLRPVKETYNKRLNALPHLVSAWADNKALAYLSLRQVSYEDCPSVEYDPEEQRLYFSVWSPSKEFHPAYHTRSIREGQGWRFFGTDKKHYMFGDSDKFDRCVVVEGVWDALRIGLNCFALLGTACSETQRVFLKKFREVALFLDPDDAGEEGSEKLRKKLLYDGVTVKTVKSLKEPGDLDPGNKILRALKYWVKG